MIFRSPYPDIAIPDMPLTPFVLRHADAAGGQTGADRRSERPDADLRATRRGRASHGRRSDAARLPQRRRLRHGLPEHPGIRRSPSTASPRSAARRRCSIRSSPPGRWHRQLADAGARFVLTVPERLDTVREAVAADAASRRSSSSARPTDATPFAALLAHDGPLPAVEIDPAEDVVAPAVFQRDDRPAEGRDADPPQPGRQGALLAARWPRSPEDESSSSSFPSSISAASCR